MSGEDDHDHDDGDHDDGDHDDDDDDDGDNEEEVEEEDNLPHVSLRFKTVGDRWILPAPLQTAPPTPPVSTL